MIFDSNMMMESANLDAVQESPYPLGIEGGLMHVYENECNFNAIMKAAGISELKYYKETGGDLFVQEAGAAGGLIDKFVSFFNKVKEKVLQIFKKFVMFISSKVSDDKKFATKYKQKVLDNFKNFKFKGYKFTDLVSETNNISKAINTHFNFDNMKSAENFRDTETGRRISDEDAEEKINEFRGKILNKSSINEDEFKEELQNKLHGGDSKEEFEVDSKTIILAFENISDFKKNIKDVDNQKNAIIKKINDIISNMEKAKKLISDSISKDDDADTATNKGDQMAALTTKCTICKDKSNVVTATFSAIVGAFKDRNRQDKAMCVKALNSGSRKSTDESAMYNGSDIFANVEII